ncbi:WXG100 family type VII secretion target [Polymorphospora sp. NPDC051019]|uniref:WXG100 family type VII secretion target n=1 Tax=unclassified Polymorphospora TaxID=2685497 RepID=UPI0033D1FD1D
MRNDDVLVVRFGQMQQASADIQKALNTLGAQLDQLERDAAPLVAKWDGEASQAYRIRQDRWRASSAELQAMLREIKVALDDSAADYLATDRRAAELFS